MTEFNADILMLLSHSVFTIFSLMPPHKAPILLTCLCLMYHLLKILAIVRTLNGVLFESVTVCPSETSILYGIL